MSWSHNQTLKSCISFFSIKRLVRSNLEDDGFHLAYSLRWYIVARKKQKQWLHGCRTVRLLVHILSDQVTPWLQDSEAARSHLGWSGDFMPVEVWSCLSISWQSRKYGRMPVFSWCVGSFFVVLLKYPDKNNLREKGWVLAYSSRYSSLWQERHSNRQERGMVEGARGWLVSLDPTPKIENSEYVLVFS